MVNAQTCEVEAALVPLNLKYDIMYEKCANFVKVVFICRLWKQQYGGCLKSVFSFQFYDNNWWTIGVRDVKFGMEADYKQTYKLYMKCSQVNSYKHGIVWEKLT